VFGLLVYLISFVAAEPTARRTPARNSLFIVADVLQLWECRAPLQVAFTQVLLFFKYTGL
jgi:hypothetical protein